MSGTALAARGRDVLSCKSANFHFQLEFLVTERTLVNLDHFVGIGARTTCGSFDVGVS